MSDTYDTYATETADPMPAAQVRCAVLHTDGKGNTIPCPGYPHALTEPQPPASLPLGADGQPDLQQHCPRCTDAVVNLEEHLQWCPDPDTAAEDDDTTEAAERAARIDAARVLLDEDRKERQGACLAAIQAACDRYGMDLTIEPARLTLVPKE